jgi:hypothetical protein
LHTAELAARQSQVAADSNSHLWDPAPVLSMPGDLAGYIAIVAGLAENLFVHVVIVLGLGCSRRIVVRCCLWDVTDMRVLACQIGMQGVVVKVCLVAGSFVRSSICSLLRSGLRSTGWSAYCTVLTVQLRPECCDSDTWVDWRQVEHSCWNNFAD